MSFFDSLQRLFLWIGNNIMSFFDSLQQKDKQEERIDIIAVTPGSQQVVHTVVPVHQDEVARQNRTEQQRIQKLITTWVKRLDQQELAIQEVQFTERQNDDAIASLKRSVRQISSEHRQIKNEHKEIRESIEQKRQSIAALLESYAELRGSIAELRESNPEIRGRLTQLKKDYANLAADSRAMHRQMREITMSQQALQNEMQELRKADDRLLETIRETEALIFQLKTVCDRVVGAVQPQHMKGFSSMARTTYVMLYRLHQAFHSMPIPTLVDNTEQDERVRRHNAHKALHSFECPITKQIMQDPVKAEDHHSAEDVRAQIQELDHQSSTPRCDQ